MLLVCCCYVSDDDMGGFVKAGRFAETGSITTAYVGDDGGVSGAPGTATALDGHSVEVLVLLDGLGGGSGGLLAMVCLINGSFKWMHQIHHGF